MTEQQATSKRLNLSPQTVDAAKVAYAKKEGSWYDRLDLQRVYFREVLDDAVHRFLPIVSQKLAEAGFVKRDAKYRQRPVGIESWKKLGEVAEEHGVARIDLVQACLELLARSEP